MEILETLRNYINERVVGQLSTGFDDDYDLIDSGTIDSVFLMGLIIYIERHYNIEFGMNDVVPKHFKSVNALADFVRSRSKEPSDI